MFRKNDSNITLLIFTLFIVLATAGAATAVDVTIDGTTALTSSNAETSMECSDSDNAPSCEVDPMGNLNCSLCVTDVGTEKLETATFLISQAGLERKRRTASALLSHEFFVPLGEAPYLGENNVLAANVGVSYEIQGMMAVAGEASAEVEVVLTVTDLDTGSVVAMETLYENEVTAGIDPQATIGAGVLLPTPDGEGGIDVGFEFGTEKAVIETDGSAAVSFLVLRGHTYSLEVSMVNFAQVNVTGGLAVSSFTNGEDIFLSNLPDFLDPRLWLEGIADRMLDFPEMPAAGAIFSNSLTIPGFTSFDEFAGRAIYGGKDMGRVCINGPKDGPCDFYEWHLPDADAVHMPTIPKKEIAPQTLDFNMIGGLTDMSTILSQAGLPDLTNGELKFSKLLENDWIKFSGMPEEPAFSDGGVRIKDIVITVQGDRRRESTIEFDQIVSNDNHNRDLAVANDNANRDAMMANDNANRDATMANDNANRDATLANANANRDTMLADAAANRETIVANDDANRETIVTNDNTNRDTIVNNDDENRIAILEDANANTNSILVNADAMRDAIITNDNANTDAIMTNDNENTDILFTLAEMLADRSLRREIQNNLGAEQCEPWMYTREYADAEETIWLGGRLEIVVEVIQTVIDHAWVLETISERDLEHAQEDLDEIAFLEAREAQEICRQLSQAYKKATVSGH